MEKSKFSTIKSFVGNNSVPEKTIFSFWSLSIGVNERLKPLKYDEISGQTVSSGTVLRMVDGIVSLTNDCRHCVTDTNERIIENVTNNSAKYDFHMEVVVQSKPYFIDKNGTVVTGAQGAISKELLEKGISMIVE